MRSRLVVASAVAVAAAILTMQLVIPPIIGLANNGDFDRVMSSAGFGYVGNTRSENFVNWVLPRYRLVARQPGSFFSSETLLALAAAGVARAFGAGTFDIRLLGVVHALLLLWAIGLMVRSAGDLSIGVQCLVAMLLVFLFTDVGYAAPFNSLYTQTASFLFFMLTCGLAAEAIRRGKLNGALCAGYFVCGALFIASRPQEAVHGPVLAVLGLSLGGFPRGRWWRAPAVWLGVLLCAWSLWCYGSTPDSYRRLALYNTLFRELIPNSPDPARDLADLGLDPSLVRFAKRSPYPLDSPYHEAAFQAQVFGPYTYGALLRFYALHPARLGSLIERTLPSAFRLRPLVLANYTQESGKPSRTMTTRFAWWSDLKLRFARGAAVWLALLLGGNAALCVSGYRRSAHRGRQARQGIAALVVMAVLEYGVAALADIPGDLARHLYVFHAMCDVMIVVDAAWIASLASRRTARLA
jgi:hypothetical protein